MSFLDLTADYTVRYRNHSEDFVVFRYDRGSHILVPTGYDNLIYIERQSDSEAWVMNNQYVLFMDASGLVSVGQLSSSPKPNDFPRLDFCRQYTDIPETIASLHQNGRLTVPDAFELDLQEDGSLMLGDGTLLDLGFGNSSGAGNSGDDQMIFYNMIAFNRLGLYAVKMEERGLLSNEAGSYLALDNQGTMLEI